MGGGVRSDLRAVAMTSSSKRKGNDFERELVREAKVHDVLAERAYASDGRALGEAKEVDLIVGGMRIQARRRKAVAAYLQIPEGADGVVFRQDRGETLVLVHWSDLLDKLGAGDW